MAGIQLNLIHTLGLVGLILVFGYWLKQKVPALRNVPIPAAIYGGLIFAILNTIAHELGIGFVEIDTSLNNIAMVLYFTTIGLSASISRLKGFGGTVVKLFILAALLATVQNFVAVGLGSTMGVEGPVALMMGSAPLVGGPGNVAAMGPVVESYGYAGATTVGMTAATLGIAIGGLLAGPTGERLIKKHNLRPKDFSDNVEVKQEDTAEKETGLVTNVTKAVQMILVAMFFGEFVTNGIEAFLGNFVEGITFPDVLGPMIIGFLLRLASDKSEKPFIPSQGVSAAAEFNLDIFLGLTIVNLKFWEIFNLAGIMAILLVVGIIITLIYNTFISYNILGKDYDSAVMVTGMTGFGIGTSTNAMAGMKEVTDKYGQSIKAVLSISIICGVFLDFINIMVIYGFIGWLV